MRCYLEFSTLEKNKIDGLGFAYEIREELSFLVEKIKRTRNIRPKIAIILVGHHEPSEIYVKQKQKVADSIGISADMIRFDENIKEDEVIKKIQLLNQDVNIHGLIVQLPLPRHINSSKVLLAVSPEKDLDGLHPLNAGLLHTSKNVPYTIDEVLNMDLSFASNDIEKFSKLGKTTPFVPCTPIGCLHLINKVLQETNDFLEGKNAVIFGNSNLVSKPMARLLLQSGATTTTLHSKSQNFAQVVENADIIVSATGKKQNLGKIKDSAILIDVGIHKEDGKDGIFGDLDFQLLAKTNRITPVPKGVGPMTVASLMVNSFLSAFKSTAS